MNPVLLEAIVKPSVLLVLAAAIMLPLRRASAAMRHMVWTMAVAGLLLLPIGARALPNWNLAWPISAGEDQGAAPVMEPEERAAGLQMGPVVGTEDSRANLLSLTQFAGGYLTDRPIPWAVFFVALYGVGVSILFVRLVAERWTLHRMTRGKVAIHDQDWNRLLLECAQCMNLQRPVRLLRGLDHTMPMVFGIWRPTVLIPSVADTWSNDRRRAVLLHELAHVGRHDCLRQLMATLACTVYWVNPGVWWLAQRMRVEGERACDDRVVAAGMTPRDYAGHLIELAYALRGHRAPGIAVSMARPREIEARLVAVLDSARNRSTPATRSRVASIIIMGALVLPLAAAGSPVTSTDATATKELFAQPPEDLNSVAANARERGGRSTESPVAIERGAASSASPLVDVRLPQNALSQALDPGALVRRARIGLGGDARLSDLRTFSASGIVNQMGAMMTYEIISELPANFRRNYSGFRSQVSGFTAAGLLRPMVFDPQLPFTVEEIDERNRREAPRQRRDFARLILGAFLISLPDYPLSFGAASAVRLPDGTEATAIEVNGPESFSVKVVLDSRTGLPAFVSWNQVDIVWPDGPIRVVPGPLAQMQAALAQLPTVEHRLVFSDRRTVSGLQVPFAIDHTSGGRSYETMTFQTFQVNVAIPQDTFQTENR